VLLAFVLANLRYVGFWLVGVGFALNILVISLNGGMPVGDHALRTASGSRYQETLHDLVATGGAKHHLQRPSDKLVPLTDVIPLGPPVRNVFSVGDLVALGGVAWVMAETTKGPPGKHRARARRGGERASAQPPSEDPQAEQPDLVGSPAPIGESA
jgi:uncharacterized protein DUF5317